MKTALKALLVIANISALTAVVVYLKKKNSPKPVTVSPAEQDDIEDTYFTMSDMDSFFGRNEAEEEIKEK